MPGYVASANTFVNMSFLLDGELSGSYMSNPTPTETDTAYRYNVSVYDTTGLKNSQHTLVMVPLLEPNASVILFDWAEYM